MCDMRPAGIDEGVWILIMDVVVDVVLFFQQIAEVRSGLVERLALPHAQPLELIVRLYAVGIEVLENAVIF